jgi:iron(III)-enterobactin esterase
MKIHRVNSVNSGSPIFDRMQQSLLQVIHVETRVFFSYHLGREVILDMYLPETDYYDKGVSLLLINDGQGLAEFNFSLLLDQLLAFNEIQPVICIGIHAGKERLSEYGVHDVADYAGRGDRAGAYTRFALEELLPFIAAENLIERFARIGFAGFSLGGLSALDIVWSHPDQFSIAGVFSGSLWWRSRALDKGYHEDRDRIIHQKIRKGQYEPGLRFYFTTGSLDETADRNGNGIIDSIDDTLDLIEELKKKGYDSHYDIRYVNFEEGRHDMATWGKAMPGFLLWAFGRELGKPLR